MDSTDLYPRPNRDEIAARVNGQLPGAASEADDLDDVVTRTDEPDYLASFTTHLNARMRALGWPQATLGERLSITPHKAAQAINGTGVSLQLAGEIAAVVGLTLPQMLGPYVCGTCEGAPPAGFRCLECDAEGERL